MSYLDQLVPNVFDQDNEPNLVPKNTNSSEFSEYIFPYEIWAHIISKLPRYKDLVELSQTCHFLYKIVKEEKYRWIQRLRWMMRIEYHSLDSFKINIHEIRIFIGENFMSDIPPCLRCKMSKWYNENGKIQVNYENEITNKSDIKRLCIRKTGGKTLSNIIENITVINDMILSEINVTTNLKGQIVLNKGKNIEEVIISIGDLVESDRTDSLITLEKGSSYTPYDICNKDNLNKRKRKDLNQLDSKRIRITW